MSNLEHFNTLGVKSTATIAQIKRAYKALAKKYHPDKNRNNQIQNPSSIDFPKIQEAYQSLKKQHERSKAEKLYQSTLKQSLLERLQGLDTLLDSGSSESSEQDYLLHRTIEARTLKQMSQRLTNIADNKSSLPAQSRRGAYNIQLIQKAIHNGLGQSSSSSGSDEPTVSDKCPSQQQILRMKLFRKKIFTVYRNK